MTVACVAVPLHAQDWKPTRTRNIEITVSSGAGGAADREAREPQRHMQAHARHACDHRQ